LDDRSSDSNRSASTAQGGSARLERWLEQLTVQRGSDLYLVAGVPPSIRVDGVIRPLAEQGLSGDEIEAVVLPAIAPHAVECFRAHGYADGSIRHPGVGRFRVNLHRERGRAAAAIRALPLHPPRLADLGLPPTSTRCPGCRTAWC
jgi:Tfp pilus assembly ATPase PilU